jgi:hypothetical protein
MILYLSCSILIVIRSIVSPTLNANPTLFVIPCNFLRDYRFSVLHILSLTNRFSSKFQSSMTIVYHKLLTREGRILANRWAHPSSMTIFVHLSIRSVSWKNYHSDIKYHITLNIIFGVVTLAIDMRVSKSVLANLRVRHNITRFRNKLATCVMSHWLNPTNIHMEI